MIYSVHNPVSGAFEYFEAPPDVAINDDLPTPRWGRDVKTKLGVPSSMAGRPLPAGAQPRGSGPQPVGLMSSGQQGLWVGTKKGSLPSGLGLFDAGSRWPVMFAGAAVAVFLGMVAWEFAKGREPLEDR